MLRTLAILVCLFFYFSLPDRMSTRPAALKVRCGIQGAVVVIVANNPPSAGKNDSCMSEAEH